MAKIGVLIPKPDPKDKKKVDIHEKISELLTATLSTKNGNTYKIGVNPKGMPIIKSEKTQRIFSLLWRDILSLAVAMGIDKDEPIENPLDILEEEDGKGPKEEPVGDDNSGSDEGSGGSSETV